MMQLERAAVTLRVTVTERVFCMVNALDSNTCESEPN